MTVHCLYLLAESTDQYPLFKKKLAARHRQTAHQLTLLSGLMAYFEANTR